MRLGDPLYTANAEESVRGFCCSARDSHEGIAVGRFSSEVSRSHAQDRTEGERLPGDLWDVQGVAFSIVSP